MRFRFYYPIILLLVILGCSKEKPLPEKPSAEKPLFDPDLWAGAEEAVLAVHRKYNADMLSSYENCVFEKTIKTNIDSTERKAILFDSLLIKNLLSAPTGIYFGVIKDLQKDTIHAVEFSDLKFIHLDLERLYGNKLKGKFNVVPVSNESLKIFVSQLDHLSGLSTKEINEYLFELFDCIYGHAYHSEDYVFNDSTFSEGHFKNLLKEEFGVDASAHAASSNFFEKDLQGENQMLSYHLKYFGYLVFKYSIINDRVVLDQYFIPHKKIERLSLAICGNGRPEFPECKSL